MKYEVDVYALFTAVEVWLHTTRSRKDSSGAAK